MKNRIKCNILPLATLSLIVICVGVAIFYFPNKSGTNTALADVIQNTFEKKIDVTKALAGLESCMKECSQFEAKIAEKIHKIISEISSPDFSYEEYLPRAALLLSEILELYTQEEYIDDAATNLQKAVELLSSKEDMGENGDYFEAKIKEILDRLMVSHPERKDFVKVYGAYILATKGSLEESLSTYKKCLQIDSSDDECSEKYQRAVFVYNEPYCAPQNINQNFGISVASAMKTNTTDRGVTLTTSDGDFERLGYGKTIFHEYALHFTLTEQGRRKLLNATQRLKKGQLDLVVDDKIIGRASYQNPVDLKAGEIGFGFNTTFEQMKAKFQSICHQETIRELPEEFKL